jgi:ankyrin repeat protein
MQDEQEYTVLALAARPGLREIVLQLLPRGANPNSTSYQGASLLAHASVHLAQARMAQDDKQYARILSCIVALTNRGAKPKPDSSIFLWAIF